ncbi:MAG: hypothetical protein HQM16_14520 [Deltaproteobacteria bacterium]|nr:hypothetical protein [Deltaproteobacteria bacterium]
MTGLGSVVPAVFKDSPESQSPSIPLRDFLKNKKMKKFMGRQDELALVAAGRAIEASGIDEESLKHQTGIYLAVGYIPFEEEDFNILAANSEEAGVFSMKKLSTDGFSSMHPFLTFRCLPNMPLFHISVNYGITGPYFISYPGPGQFYLALLEAVRALEAGEVEIALVGGVAHQKNLLVDLFYKRVPELSGLKPVDAAGFIVLETSSHAEQRGASVRVALKALHLEYIPHDPLVRMHDYRESLTNVDAIESVWTGGYPGAALLPVRLESAINSGCGGLLRHKVTTVDGVCALSEWEIT